MTFRVRYRDKRRPWASPCLERVQVDCSSDVRTAAKVAAAVARGRLRARGINAQILGIAAD